ncbi:STAS/SEC14 domain-containing protein [Pontibacter pamirensis]|uniref:STAS/SEC14 domain-containing protein n=1 Tax=Pontibacter pamirensis TaxID=2562824 RepID=UPI001389BDEA|nr:STAS/SEC14 domain-containing protein [Pontibacter pamirensis]
MKQEFRNAFGKVFLTVTVDKENRWVHTNWNGYLTEENIRVGALAYTEAVKEAGVNCVLNDTRQIIGSWDHSLDWVVNQWGPQAARAGIKHFALITNPASFAEVTATSFYSNLKAFEVKIFDDKAEAEAWLRQFTLAGK